MIGEEPFICQKFSKNWGKPTAENKWALIRSDWLVIRLTDLIWLLVVLEYKILFIYLVLRIESIPLIALLSTFISPKAILMVYSFQKILLWAVALFPLIFLLYRQGGFSITLLWLLAALSVDQRFFLEFQVHRVFTDSWLISGKKMVFAIVQFSRMRHSFWLLCVVI